MKKLLLLICFCIFSLKIHGYTLQKSNINLSYPWGMTWIDSTKLLITEKKTAQIILFDTSNNTSNIISHKIPVASWGQGGLLDIISEGDNIWITCSIMKDKLLTTAVYKSTLNNNSLIDSELIFEATLILITSASVTGRNSAICFLRYSLKFSIFYLLNYFP